MKASAMSKTVLITGASSGIGAATAQRLLGAGWSVYAAARRLDRMKALEAAGATLVSLDLTDDASIVAAVAAVEREAGRLDALVNNAGYGSYGAVEDVPMAEARRQVEVNLFGLARLIQLATPIMRRQKSGRIVNVTSIGGKMWEPLGGWYHATKFAVEGLSDCLRMELEPFGIDVIVIEPGAIRTEWSAIARTGLIETSGSTAYRDQAERHARLLAGTENNSMVSEPDVVAVAITRSLTAARPKTRYAVGGGAKPILLMVRLLPDRMFDRFMRMIIRRFGR
jgi:NAD(P)-dependent dehydrogenase (short-subunit alcohol dehydrogenase family)